MRNGVAAGFLIEVPECTLPLLSCSVPSQATNVSVWSQHHGISQSLQWKNCQGTKVSNVNEEGIMKADVSLQ